MNAKTLKTFRTVLACLLLAGAAAAIAVFLLLLGTDRLERMNDILGGAETVSSVEEARELLRENGIPDFSPGREGTLLFWGSGSNRVQEVAESEFAAEDSAWTLQPGIEPAAADASGEIWYPLEELGLADRLAGAELSAGSFSQVLPAALGCREGDFAYTYYQKVLGESVVLNGGTYYTGDGEQIAALGREDAAERAAAQGISLALLGEENAAAGFSGFTSLREVYVAEGVTRLGAGVFSDCVSLETVTLPQTLTAVEAAAFSRCSALKEIDLGGITALGESAFFASGLERVTLPAGVKAVPMYAFGYCASLVHAEFPGATEIGEAAFYLCEKLESVSAPAAERVEKEAFFLCGKLTTFDFVTDGTEIGEDAFFGTSYAGRA